MGFEKMKFRDKYEKLVTDNKQMSKKLIELNSKLLICQQKYLSIESAFDLSQKLVQHLKTENQLLRSSTDFLSLNNPMDQPIAITSTTDITNNHTVVATDCNQSVDSNPNSDLCKSDLIAIQYENEIKELREAYNLLCCLPIDEVVITHEDQLNAGSHLYSDESEAECDEQMDIEFNVMSSKMSETSEVKAELKCKYCGRKFIDETVFNEHKALHLSSDGNQIRCAEDLCGHQFNSKHELKEHLKSIHKNRQKTCFKFSSMKAKFDNNSNQTKGVFQCNECNKQLSSMQNLRQHQKAVHNIISTFKCKFGGCDQKFEKIYELRAHEVIHRKEIIKPSVVSTSNKSNGKVEEQATPLPAPKRQFACQYEGCNSSYMHRTSLKKHEEKYHTIITSPHKTAVINLNQSPETTGDAVIQSVPQDFQAQLQLLNLFYSEQQKIAQQL